MFNDYICQYRYQDPTDTSSSSPLAGIFNCELKINDVLTLKQCLLYPVLILQRHQSDRCSRFLLRASKCQSRAIKGVGCKMLRKHRGKIFRLAQICPGGWHLVTVDTRGNVVMCNTITRCTRCLSVTGEQCYSQHLPPWSVVT